jgi:hypothetical protein
MASAYPNLVRPGALRDNAIISPHAIKHAGLITAANFLAAMSRLIYFGAARAALVSGHFSPGGAEMRAGRAVICYQRSPIQFASVTRTRIASVPVPAYA